MDSGKFISRGQRKRLAKKSKFVNQRLMEKTFIDREKQEHTLRQEKEKVLREARGDLVQMVKPTNLVGGDMDMSDIVTKPQAPKKQQQKASLSDFGAMGDLLNKIETKTTKQVNH